EQDTISPCSVLSVTVVVTIPQGTAIDVQDWLTLSVTSQQTDAMVQVNLETKTPAPVLLVDDDRWYQVEHKYFDALNQAGIPYDRWDNQDNIGGIPGSRSPSTKTLELYPIVLWFTGYDWYEPVSEHETAQLLYYIDQGGKIILSSQDFLYYHESDTLAQQLGIQSYSDGENIINVSGTSHPSSGYWHDVVLEYPFPLHSDIVEPSPDAAIVLRGQNGQPVGVATTYAKSNIPASLFYGLSLEALPIAMRSGLISQNVGWLSPLGESQWFVNPGVGSAGESLTYTLVLHNNNTQDATVSAAHYVPVGQLLQIQTLPPELTYNDGLRRLTWHGQLTPKETLTYTWETRVQQEPTATIYPTVTLFLEDWGIAYELKTAFYGLGPNITASSWVSPVDIRIRPKQTVTLAFALRNNSEVSVPIQADMWLMEGLSPLTSTLLVTGETRGWFSPWWSGLLEAHTTHTLTLPVHSWLWEDPVRVDARIKNEYGDIWTFPLWLYVTPWDFYLPRVTRQK
ncbi:MAG: hypothetical protein P1S60_00330, partial [Anaerolineae bacterium]|nr:hypothetical protein [Anaerolineae bacterium]